MDMLVQRLSEHWQAIVDDPDTTPGNRRHAEWKLENLRRSAEGQPPLPVPEELRDPSGPHFSSTLYLIEHPRDELE
jgi:hypothetical protein